MKSKNNSQPTAAVKPSIHLPNNPNIELNELIQDTGRLAEKKKEVF